MTDHASDAPPAPSPPAAPALPVAAALPAAPPMPAVPALPTASFAPPGFAPSPGLAMPASFAPIMPPAPTPVASPATGATSIVLGRWPQYRFAEAPIPEKAQIKVLASPPMPSDLPPPDVIDPGLEALAIALERQTVRMPIAPVDYAPGRATDWLLFSPFELFMEQVLARKLGTLE